MAIPPNAKAVGQPLDPADVVDFMVTLTQGEGQSPPALLLPGEMVAAFTLTLPVESVAVGLQIKNGGSYPAPVISGLNIVFWLGIDPMMQSNAMFAGAGVTLAIELTITTTASPARIKQRTLTIAVANQ